MWAWVVGLAIAGEPEVIWEWAPSAPVPAEVLKGPEGYIARSVNDAAAAPLDRAETAFRANDYAGARAAYQEAMVADPEHPMLRVFLGDTYFGEKDFVQALAWYDKALELHPTHPQALWFGADALWEMGKREESVERLVRALVVSRTNPRLLGDLQSKLSRLDDPWQDWSVPVQYSLVQQDGKITMGLADPTSEASMGHALVWMGAITQPAELAERCGAWTGDTVCIANERSAAKMWLETRKRKEKKLAKRILKENWVDEFALFEIVAPARPGWMMGLTPQQLDRVVEYVRIFH